MDKFPISQRRACRALGQSRSTERRSQNPSAEEKRLTEAIVSLATKYGRYGYRRITALLQKDHWQVNHKRVERIWRRGRAQGGAQEAAQAGQAVAYRRLCIRLRPEHKDHVWSYDFVEDRTTDGRKFRSLNIIDEFTRDCLCVR